MREKVFRNKTPEERRKEVEEFLEEHGVVLESIEAAPLTSVVSLVNNEEFRDGFNEIFNVLTGICLEYFITPGNNSSKIIEFFHNKLFKELIPLEDFKEELVRISKSLTRNKANANKLYNNYLKRIDSLSFEAIIKDLRDIFFKCLEIESGYNFRKDTITQELTYFSNYSRDHLNKKLAEKFDNLFDEVKIIISENLTGIEDNSENNIKDKGIGIRGKSSLKSSFLKKDDKFFNLEADDTLLFYAKANLYDEVDSLTSIYSDTLYNIIKGLNFEAVDKNSNYILGMYTNFMLNLLRELDTDSKYFITSNFHSLFEMKDLCQDLYIFYLINIDNIIENIFEYVLAEISKKI